MATRILLFGLIIAGLSSCATYRTGQTPDDVYYSPAREVNEYVQVDRNDDNRLSYNESNLEDLRLRQQIRDPRFRFDDNIYWNTPSYNSWGWNTWNNPYNTWGWNNGWGISNGFGWNNYNYGYGYSGYGYGGYKGWNSGYVCIPGANNLIIIAGPGAPKNSTGVRYSAPIQRFANAGTNYNNGKGSGTGSRYFNGNTNNNNSTRRTGLFGGNGSNSSNSGGSRLFGNSNTESSSNSGGSRTFSNSGSSSSSSNSSSSGSSSSGSKSTTPSRRN